MTRSNETQSPAAHYMIVIENVNNKKSNQFSRWNNRFAGFKLKNLHFIFMIFFYFCFAINELYAQRLL